jgi:xanthine dehydrogenase molybdopterin-binding subunit B
VDFFKSDEPTNVIYGSKAVGEPPLMLAISVREALRDAIAAFGEATGPIELPSPATAEAIFMAVRKRATLVSARLEPRSRAQESAARQR